MKPIKRLLCLIIIHSILFSFNTYAMNNILNFTEPIIPTPQIEEKHEDRSFDYFWTWLDDDLCVRFKPSKKGGENREALKRSYDFGLLNHWRVDSANLKTRDTYTGKWTQSENSIWSFQFDDYTIPVGVTKIDGALYAFNGFGELQDGVIYYGKPKTPFDSEGCLKTGSDGLVTADSAEFQAWLATQYVPECTSHE